MKKNNFYVIHADVCKTLSNPRRQAIIDALRDGPLTVNDLIGKTDIPQANLSQHLAILRAKNVVKTKKEGNHVYYSISNSKIIKAYDLISEVLMEELSNRSDMIKKSFKK
ncbi:MAG: metalloregulator ArsR/SmtB family transcription factor [Actinomycetia bacterium]|nr:metalloregulator ArsR/SmtB family transcription factor [Actinomycetes bacterium]